MESDWGTNIRGLLERKSEASRFTVNLNPRSERSVRVTAQRTLPFLVQNADSVI